MSFWRLRIFGSDETTEAVASAPAPSAHTKLALTRLDECDLGGIVVHRHDTSFVPEIKSYWSSQAQQVIPAAIVKPRFVKQLSTVLSILSTAFKASKVTVPFEVAIRSGGHSPIRNFASADNGIVLDLANFNHIRLDEDQQTVELGVGARWKDVYNTLDPLNLSVAGGRASDVGVGGLTLGGGLSFFSAQAGLSCDSVIGMEAVLADGTVLEISSHLDADLLMALKGGGNNFAVVTRVTMRTFPQGKVWSGSLYHYKTIAPQLMIAWYDFCNSKTYDKDCTGMIVFGFSGKWQAMTPLSIVQCLKPVRYHPALQRFVELRHFWSSMKIRTVSEAAADIGGWSPNGYRHHWHNSTFENDLEVMQHAFEAYEASLEEVKHIKGVIWSLVFQPIFPSATAHHASNAIGLHSNKTLTIALIAVTWDRAEDDALIFGAATRLFDKIDAFAREKGVFHPFKYVNYSGADQKPYDGFGPGKMELLRKVSRKYDPDGFFQKAVRGGFKLGDV